LFLFFTCPLSSCCCCQSSLLGQHRLSTKMGTMCELWRCEWHCTLEMADPSPIHCETLGCGNSSSISATEVKELSRK
jgi:hypothetical protein